MPHRSWAEQLYAEFGEPVAESSVRGHHKAWPSLAFGAGKFDDQVVTASGSRSHVDSGGADDGAGLALDDEDDVDGGAGLGEACGGEIGEGVAEAGGGAGAVTPPAVGDGADDIGGVDHEQRCGHGQQGTT